MDRDRDLENDLLLVGERLLDQLRRIGGEGGLKGNGEREREKRSLSRSRSLSRLNERRRRGGGGDRGPAILGGIGDNELRFLFPPIGSARLRLFGLLLRVRLLVRLLLRLLPILVPPTVTPPILLAYLDPLLGDGGRQRLGLGERDLTLEPRRRDLFLDMERERDLRRLPVGGGGLLSVLDFERDFTMVGLTMAISLGGFCSGALGGSSESLDGSGCSGSSLSKIAGFLVSFRGEIVSLMASRLALKMLFTGKADC